MGAGSAGAMQCGHSMHALNTLHSGSGGWVPGPENCQISRAAVEFKPVASTRRSFYLPIIFAMTSCEGALQKSAGLRISFGGCAALGVYYGGVCKCLLDHAPDVLDDFEQLYGASAGAFAAVCVVCKVDPMTVYEWIMELFKLSREYSILGIVSPSFDLFTRMRNFVEAILPRDAHRLCRNRVHISLSVLDGFGLPKNWLLTDFTTRKELINVRHSPT